MNIPKPIRHIGYAAIAGVGTGFFIAFTRPFLGGFSFVFAPVVFIVLHVIGGLPIDVVDLWLRRTTRDPVWLIGHEGRQWLETDEGKRWSEANR